ncbi:MAG: hypothetical protein K6G90_02870 [Clostridia bacterium]|nr:hypothetical protein [Clostridia bacterium]
MDDTNKNPMEKDNTPADAPESHEDLIKRLTQADPAWAEILTGPEEEKTAKENAPESFDEFMSRQEGGNEPAAYALPAEGEIPVLKGVPENFDEFMSRQEGGKDPSAYEEAQTDEAYIAEAKARTEAAEQEATAKAKKKGNITIILTVVLVVLIAAAAALMWMLFGKQASGDYSSPVVTVNGETSDGYEFALSFGQIWQYYSYYGISDTATIKQNVVDQLAYINMTAKAAKDEGLELDEDDLAQAEEQIKTIVEAAEESSVSAEEFIRQQYGFEIPLEKLRAIMEKQSLAQKYINKVIDEKNAAYADNNDAIEAEYETNRKDYDVCHVSYIFLESTEDAVHITDAVAEGKSLGDAASEIAGDAEIKQLDGYTYNVLSQSFSQDAADWIFKTDDDGNYITESGATKVVTIQGGTYVLYQNNVPGKDETTGENGTPAWIGTVANTLSEKDMQTWYDEFTAAYANKVTTDDAAIDTIIAAITGQDADKTTAAVNVIS